MALRYHVLAIQRAQEPGLKSDLNGISATPYLEIAVSYPQAKNNAALKIVPGHNASGGRHGVQFYESEQYLCEAVCRFLAPGFADGNPLLVIAIPEHQKLFDEGLRSRVHDFNDALRTGQLIHLDARETLAEFMEDELPNGDRFLQMMGTVIQKIYAGHENRMLFVYGEMADLLWREEKREAAILLERLWNELADSYQFELLCACGIHGFSTEADQAPFEKICRTHSNVTPTEDYMDLDKDERLLEIALLQQRARALQSEVQYRKEIEAALLRSLNDGREKDTRLRETDVARSFLTAIIESSEDAIVSKNLNGIVTSWNSGAEKIFGYKALEMIGRPITVLIPSDHLDEEPNILERIRRGERIDHYETKRVRKDGLIIDISLTVSPVRNNEGKVIGASKIARDITEKKRIEAERDELLSREQMARSEAEAANRVKDEFLATLSHELRTPLSAILGWTRLLSSNKDEDMIQRAVAVIQRNAEMQKRLIEDLMDMKRILTGKMIIKPGRVDLPAVLNAAADSVRAAANAKGISMDIDLDGTVRYIAGDSDRLQQVVWNLLSNAVKFTPIKGSVVVRLQNLGSHVEISVRDTGEGISADFLPHAFERFTQADGGTTRQHEGIGVGLAVVRYLVEAHGGTVRAISRGKGQGATFIASLPTLGGVPHVAD